jgi:hypothetical protein
MVPAILSATFLLPALFTTALASPLYFTRDQKWIDIQMMTRVCTPYTQQSTTTDVRMQGPPSLAERRKQVHQHHVRRMQGS